MTSRSKEPPSEDPDEREEPREAPNSRFRLASGEISDVQTLLEVVRRELQQPSFWVFRGQADWEWSLRPKRGRSSSPDEKFPIGLPEEDAGDSAPRGVSGFLGEHFPSISDRGEFDNWKSEAVALLPPTLPAPASDLDWLAIGQHYGLSTRLLDWTRNPLVGLYFAVRDSGYGGADSALFALRGLPVLPTSQRIDPWEIRGVRLWYPASLVERIGRQGSLFTIHQIGDKGGSLDLVSYAEKLWELDLGLAHERFFGLGDFQILKIKIPGSARPSLVRELSLLGVDEFFAFPDLQGLCTAYRNGRFRRPGMEQIFRNR